MLIPFREITIEMNLYLKDQIYWNLNIRTKRIRNSYFSIRFYSSFFVEDHLIFEPIVFFFLEFLMKICNIKNKVLVWLAMTTISLLLQVV